MQTRTTAENIQWAMERLDAAQAKQRATRPGQDYSNQDKRGNDFFGDFINWSKEYISERNDYPYASDSRKRDKWLGQFWKREPHIAGVINSVVAIDKNRGWTLTGARRLVSLYNKILRNADDGLGWREFMSKCALAFYTTDIGSIVELGRAGIFGPLRAIYSTDPVKCKLTGDRDFPLEYFPGGGKRSKKWSWADFFRVESLPSPNDDFHNLGFCALSRGIELVCLLMAVYDYDQEQLGARAPKGLLLLQNISWEQWDNAMQSRSREKDTKGHKYFGGVMTIAQEGLDQMDAKLVALSQLPAEFDREVVTNQIMYGLSLVFGYSPDEFWPVQYGALGRGRETEIHKIRANTKGGSDFTLSFQDDIQRELPETLLFEFDKRDAETDLLESNVYLSWAKVAQALYEQGMGVMDRDMLQSLLTEKGILNPQLTEIEEETVNATLDGVSATQDRSRTSHIQYARAVTRERVLRDWCMSKDNVRQSAELYPQEPVVRYHYPALTMDYLWDRGEDLIKRRIYPLPGMPTAKILPIALPDPQELTHAVHSVVEEIAVSLNGHG